MAHWFGLLSTSSKYDMLAGIEGQIMPGFMSLYTNTKIAHEYQIGYCHSVGAKRSNQKNLDNW